MLKSLVPTQSSQDKEKFSCSFQSTDNFPEWKLALKAYILKTIALNQKKLFNLLTNFSRSFQIHEGPTSDIGTLTEREVCTVVQTRNA